MLVRRMPHTSISFCILSFEICIFLLFVFGLENGVGFW